MADPDEDGTTAEAPPVRKPGESPEAYFKRVAAWVNEQKAAPYNAILNALPPNIRQNGIQIDEFHWVDPSTLTVYELETGSKGEPSFRMLSDADSKRFLGSVGATGSGGANGGGGAGSRLASDDPRYWANLDRQFQLELAKLGLDAQNIGLDSEVVRQQLLANLITNRNATAVDVAQVAASVAKNIADFAANPRDAVAELIYRNQVGGQTPFGDMTNKNFGEYGKALAAKVGSIFQPVSADLNTARNYRDAIPPVEFYGPEIRNQLGIGPTPAQQLAGGGGSPASTPAVGSPAPAPNPLVALVDRLKAMPQEEQERFRTYVTGGAYKPVAAAHGAQLNFDGMMKGRMGDGYSPASSEGGTNLNIHERAMVVGESGHIYATLGEKRPDGSMRAEQLQIKPLKSEVEKDKKLAEAEKAKVESHKQFMSSFAEGGTVNATPDDFMEQLSMLLGRLGGAGGGTGQYTTPLPSLRLLAGAPANAIAEDPVLGDYVASGYSALGIDPRTVDATIKKFTPRSPINNLPRVNFA